MIKIGLVGYGYWGPNLLRNFYECPLSEVVSVCDLSDANLHAVSLRYPTISTTKKYSDLLQNTEINAIVIATPISTHYKLALEALQKNKHVFVEKPLTSSVKEAEHLIQEASNRNLTLHVDHTFAYTPAVRKIKELVDDGSLGEMYYYDSVRINLGLFQKDVNVLWDLAVHDLSIMDYVILEKPIAISATGISHLNGNPENTAYMTLYFAKKLIAHLHVNWLAPVKIRQTLFSGSRKMLVYNDLEPSEKIRVYDTGIHTSASPEKMREMLVSYRSGDIWSPHLKKTEALQFQVFHFCESVKNGTPTETDGHSGLRVVRALEAAQISMGAKGRPVDTQTLAFI
jgi:predicted dehydrogenase